MPETKMVSVGSLVAIQYLNPPSHRLGLVVDRKAGERWVERDPFPDTRFEITPSSVLVRLMGEHTAELYHSGDDDLWGQEPCRIATVRWAYIKTNPNPPWVIAGPDTFSIEKFFGACQVCEALGMTGATFIAELKFLLGHLKQNKLVTDETGIFERRYRAMLADVLPLPH